MKDKRINLRFSEDEIELLKDKSDGQPLASFCREVVLGTRRRRRKKQTEYSNYPPEVARQLSAIGNNLNQIARLGHSARKNNSLELLQLLEAIDLVRSDIAEMMGGANVGEDV